jgi:lambda repressor-like predicted transcriptional regulator
LDPEKTLGWNRYDVIAAVRKKGSTLAGIGRSAGLSRKSIAWALIRPHPRANRAIAEFLQTPPHALWPQWFDVDGRFIAARSPGSSASPTTRVSESTPAASAPSKTAT